MEALPAPFDAVVVTLPVNPVASVAFTDALFCPEAKVIVDGRLLYALLGEAVRLTVCCEVGVEERVTVIVTVEPASG